MFIKTYDSITGSIIADPAQSLDFGDVIQGQHNTRPLVLRAFPDIETTVNAITIKLQSDGGWTDADFGFYINEDFESGVASGSEKFSHFGTPPSGEQDMGWTGTNTYYVWLDVDIPTNQTGTTDAAYRITYNYS